MLCYVMLYYYATLRYPDPFIIRIIIRKHVDVHGVEGVYRKKYGYGYDRMDIKQLRLRFSHPQPRETAIIATTMTIWRGTSRLHGSINCYACDGLHGLDLLNPPRKAALG